MRLILSADKHAPYDKFKWKRNTYVFCRLSNSLKNIWVDLKHLVHDLAPITFLHQ